VGRDVIDNFDISNGRPMYGVNRDLFVTLNDGDRPGTLKKFFKRTRLYVRKYLVGLLELLRVGTAF